MADDLGRYSNGLGALNRYMEEREMPTLTEAEKRLIMHSMRKSPGAMPPDEYFTTLVRKQRPSLSPNDVSDVLHL